MRLRGLTAFWLIALSACAGTPSTLISSGERYTPQAEGVEQYRMGPGDRIKLIVFKEPTLSGDYTVSSDGIISLPLIGEITVNGKTANEVTAMVQTMLASGYLRDPKISLEISTYRPFFVLGEVRSPGQFPYATSMTALNAIALAQGFSPRAQKSVVYIRRAGNNAEEAYSLTPDLRVLPGDTIRVGERYF